MVYDSDFSRKAFLSECAQSGQFHTSPDYQPRSSLSILRGSTSGSTTTTPALKASARDSARLIARRYLEPTSRSARDDLRFGEDSNEIDGSGDNEQYSSYSRRFTGRAKVCSCCKNCGGATNVNDRASSRLDLPMSSLSLKSSQGMESYIKSRSPFGDDGPFAKPKPTYTVRNIPVRNLDELRETVAIRRNYIKERQQMRDGLIPSSATLDDALNSIASNNSQPDAEAEGSVCSEFPESLAMDEVQEVQ